MKLKNKIFKSTWFILSIAFVALLVSCSEEDEIPEGPPPAGEFMVTINAEPGQDVTFTGTVTDEIGLASITMTNTDLALEGNINLSDNPTSFTVSYNFNIQETIADGTYPVVIVVTNTANKTFSAEVNVVVETPEVIITDAYDAIWVAGGVLWWEWGTPEGNFYEMQKDTENDGWFEIVVPAWEGFNELKFLGQNAYAPNNWGLEDNTNPNSDMQNSEESQTILLPVNGKNPVYHTVRFNPNTLEYTAVELIPEMEIQETMYIVGSGFTDYPNLDWNPEQAIEMTRNPYEYGDYQFLVEGLVFSDDVSLKFLGQNDGWGPIDMGFAGESREVLAPQNWVVLVEGDGTSDLKFKDQAGTYTIYLDYFLKRAVIWYDGE
ncbi:MAG: hypothetical protein ACJA0X_001632 [Cyclobacteriaceae bacterium]|jgi:hypothetical protein